MRFAQPENLPKNARLADLASALNAHYRHSRDNSSFLRMRVMDSRLKCNTVCEVFEYFLGCPEVEAFAWRPVVFGCEGIEVILCDGSEIGLARQRPAQSADGVFDAAFLPWRMRIAERRF